MNSILIFLCLAYIFKIFYESYTLNKYRKQIKLIIHVNGIRGKSTVCRLIDAGLRNGKLRIFTKVTGTSPRYISTNGNEYPIKRIGKANIREQIKFLKKAAEEKSDIAIFECMAVNPILQKICEQKILKSDISIITNVREDHLDLMGNTLDKIALSLSNTINKNGLFFTSDKQYFNFFQKICKTNNTKAFLSLNSYEETFDFPENINLALNVCNTLGINCQEALIRMKEYKKDSGVLKTILYTNNYNSKIYFVNALAVNDPNSTTNIINIFKNTHLWNKKRYLLVNNRRDRLFRMIQFKDFLKNNSNDFQELLISGENKNLFYREVKSFYENIQLIENLDFLENFQEDSIIFAVGNICGEGNKIIKHIENRGVLYER